MGRSKWKKQVKSQVLGGWDEGKLRGGRCKEEEEEEEEEDGEEKEKKKGLRVRS